MFVHNWFVAFEGPSGGLKLLLDAEQYEYMKYDGVSEHGFEAGKISTGARQSTVILELINLI